MSPWRRRTHRASFRSIAGYRITRASVLLAGAEPCSRAPVQEVGDEREAQPLALLGVELRAGDVVAGDEGGDRTAILRLGHDVLRALGRQGIAVHEIGVQPVLAGGNAG